MLFVVYDMTFITKRVCRETESHWLEQLPTKTWFLKYVQYTEYTLVIQDTRVVVSVHVKITQMVQKAWSLFGIEN